MKHLKAGADYLAAIQALGLDPDALFWARDEVTKQYVLVMVTPFFDFKGPYAISQLLFRAYNNAGTPRDIDPFIIRLHSPDHTIVNKLVPYIRGAIVRVIDEKTAKPRADEAGTSTTSSITVGGLMVKTNWVYQTQFDKGRRPRRKVFELARQWNRIERKVDRLAA